MLINEILEVLKPNYQDDYFKNKNDIKDILRCNEAVFYCFENADEINDFITYADIMINGNVDEAEFEKLKNTIVIKPYFKPLYKLVESYNDIVILNQLYSPLFQVENIQMLTNERPRKAKINKEKQKKISLIY